MGAVPPSRPKPVNAALPPPAYAAPKRTRPLPWDPAVAAAALSTADSVLGRLIARVGPTTLQLPAVQSPFEALVRSILYQQLHGKAAAAIHARMIDSFAELCGVGVHPSAQHLLDCPTLQLREAGLSVNKVLALRDLAAKTLDGTVPTLARIRRMPDEDIIERLTAVRGVGRWTVEMLLIFRLGRPDVLPVDDYGVRKGFAVTFQRLSPTAKVTPADLPKAEVMLKRARRWEPWRSLASWYLWRAADLATAAARVRPATPKAAGSRSR